MNIFELGAFWGLIAGTCFGAFLGLQHNVVWAFIGGVLGAPTGYFGGILAGLLFILPFQLLAIIASKVENWKKK